VIPIATGFDHNTCPTFAKDVYWLIHSRIRNSADLRRHYGGDTEHQAGDAIYRSHLKIHRARVRAAPADDHQEAGCHSTCWRSA